MRRCSRFIRVSRLKGLQWTSSIFCLRQRGNRYILTVVDQFTKHVKAYPLHDQKAVSVTRVFHNKYVSRYGVPDVIHTDQGTNFKSNLFNKISKLLGIAKTRTSPYRPQCDGQGERMNRTIIELLKLDVKNSTENLDLEIGFSLMAYCSAIQSSTKFKSYYLLYGKEIRLSFDIIYLFLLTKKLRAEHANDVCCKLIQAYESVSGKLYLAHEQQQNYYDRRSDCSRNQTSDPLWLWNSAPQKGVAPKFQEPWTGLFQVTKRWSDVTYKIFNAKRQTKIEYILTDEKIYCSASSGLPNKQRKSAVIK